MKLTATILLSLGLSGIIGNALAQGFNPSAMAREALAEPFVGISSDGSPQSGLYPIKKTGASTEPVIQAAEQFLSSLTDDQRGKIQFPVNDAEWRNWANIHRFPREGCLTG